MKNISLILAIFFLLTTTSCQNIKSRKTPPAELSYHYDNKVLLLNPAADYCFYDERKTQEADVINLIRRVNNFGVASFSEVKFLQQKCREKENFLAGNSAPRFRNTVMISFVTAPYLEQLKQHGIERNRKIYVEYSASAAAAEDIKSMNKFMKKILPQLRLQQNAKTLTQLKNLNAAQKAELKLVHAELLSKQAHVFLSYHVKKDTAIAAYNYQYFRVGKILTKCANADTLINYIPLNVAICEEGEGDDWSGLEVRLRNYVKELIELNEAVSGGK